MCTKKLFRELVHKVKTSNGAAQKELEKQKKSGKITDEDIELIKITANLELLNEKLGDANP